MTCVARLRLDAALHEPALPRAGPAAPAPPRRPGAIGRPRTKWARLPTLAKLLADKETPRRRATVPGWHGGGDRIVEIHSGTAVWRHAGPPVVPVRWVLLRDPWRRFDPRAPLCIDAAREPLQTIRWFVQRWQVEVAFRERCATTPGSRPSASGRTGRLRAPRPARSRCSPSRPCSPSASTIMRTCGSRPRIGTAEGTRPSPMHSPRRAGRSGARQVCPPPGSHRSQRNPTKQALREGIAYAFRHAA